MTSLLQNTAGPIIATTDYMRMRSPSRSVPSCRTAARIKCWAPTASAARIQRVKLREFFEVNRYYVTIAALRALADEGKIERSVVSQAIAKYRHRPEQAESCDPVNAHGPSFRPAGTQVCVHMNRAGLRRG